MERICPEINQLIMKKRQISILVMITRKCSHFDERRF
nr:MAG TPA: hypothetical protein [Caudoviricetes sp.]